MVCNRALTDSEVGGWASFTSGVCAPTPDCAAALFPFKVAPDPAACAGGLASVTVAPVAPVAGLTGRAWTTTLCEFTRGV